MWLRCVNIADCELRGQKMVKYLPEPVLLYRDRETGMIADSVPWPNPSSINDVHAYS